MSVNKVIILGTVGQDPVGKALSNGKTVCNFSVATSEKWTDKNTGEKKENTEWHNITAFDPQASIITSYVKKGDKIYVEGKMKTEPYTDKNGVERKTTKIVVNNVTLLGGRSGGQPQQQAQPAPSPVTQSAPFDDDIPF